LSAFRFEAVDADGRLREGLVDAADARAARDRLRADGLTPTAVDAAPSRDSPLQRTRLPAASLALLTRQLASLVQSGMPLDQALVAVHDQADDAPARTLVDAIRTQVLAGESLPAALSRFPRTFSPLYRGLIGAGTETGRLSEVLTRLADYLDARLALRQKFIVALIYPALVTVIAVSVIAVLVTYVVPQVVSVYQQSRQTLPLLTRALIATSDFLRATGGLWLGAFVAAVIAVAVAWRRESARERMHRALLRIPGVGRLAASLDTARYASTLAILVGSGTPLLRALDAATGVVRMLPLARAARRASALVREGVSLSRALKEQKAFPPVLIHLFPKGEQSGARSPMLEGAAA
jgi:general secretion pathway protein F